MANYKIIASGVTRIFGVGIKTLYLPAPRPVDFVPQAEGTTTIASMIHMATGHMARFHWQMPVAADQFEVQVYKVRPSDLGQALVRSSIVTAPLFTWTPAKVGIYAIWVRAKVNGTFTGWVKSDEPVITGDGASPGWLINTYLAPISGGGIK